MDACSLWEFSAAIAGWAKANGASDKAEAPTEEEHDALMAKYG